MAVTATRLGSGVSLTAAGGLSPTSSHTPVSGRKYYVVYQVRGAVNNSTTLAGANGWNTTWTVLAEVPMSGDASQRLILFVGTAVSSVAGVLTGTNPNAV